MQGWIQRLGLVRSYGSIFDLLSTFFFFYQLISNNELWTIAHQYRPLCLIINASILNAVFPYPSEYTAVVRGLVVAIHQRDLIYDARVRMNGCHLVALSVSQMGLNTRPFTPYIRKGESIGCDCLEIWMHKSIIWWYLGCGPFILTWPYSLKSYYLVEAQNNVSPKIGSPLDTNAFLFWLPHTLIYTLCGAPVFYATFMIFYKVINRES